MWATSPSRCTTASGMRQAPRPSPFLLRDRVHVCIDSCRSSFPTCPASSVCVPRAAHDVRLVGRSRSYLPACAPLDQSEERHSKQLVRTLITALKPKALVEANGRGNFRNKVEKAVVPLRRPTRVAHREGNGQLDVQRRPGLLSLVRERILIAGG